MADLLSKTIKNFMTLCAVLLLISNCACAFDNSFEEYFNKDFFNSKRAEKSKETPKIKKAKEELKARKIPQSVDGFIKYVKKGDIETMQLFLDAGFKVNTDFYTDYPIYYATKANKVESVKFLLENGADPNLGFNPSLNIAIKNKNTEIAKLLIQNGAKVNENDFLSGDSLLFITLKKKQYEIAREMIKYGARIDTKSSALIQAKNLKAVLGLD